jgi:hypothetical protein
MAFSNELLDQLCAGHKQSEDILGPRRSGARSNRGYGSSPKTMHTDSGAVAVAIPGDRAATFETR